MNSMVANVSPVMTAIVEQSAPATLLLSTVCSFDLRVRTERRRPSDERGQGLSAILVHAFATRSVRPVIVPAKLGDMCPDAD
jgi:hypothetical protein